MHLVKTAMGIVTATALSVAPAQAAVTVYESFGDGAEGDPLVGYSGTSAEIGLTGAWSVTGDDAGTTIASPPSWGDMVGIAGGHAPEAVGGVQHAVKKVGWGVAEATRSLSSPIDLTTDGTLYMSFFVANDISDFAAQVGLSNATNELMAGNAFWWGGLTAYYGTNGSDVATNEDGITISSDWTGNAFFVIELVKSNSGTTDDLAVTIEFYNLGTVDAPTNDISGGPDLSRTVALTGVSDIFDSLKFKVAGWPNMDEIRIGESWVDVTGVPEPGSLALLGVGGLMMLIRQRSRV